MSKTEKRKFDEVEPEIVNQFVASVEKVRKSKPILCDACGMKLDGFIFYSFGPSGSVVVCIFCFKNRVMHDE